MENVKDLPDHMKGPLVNHADVWEDVLPKSVPEGWRLDEDHTRKLGLHTFKKKSPRLCVLLAANIIDDKRWIHLSLSHSHRIPTFTELKEVKNAFIGEFRRAFQVLPPQDEYVNDYWKVLHLYAPLDHNPLPDFRAIDPRTQRLSI